MWEFQESDEVTNIVQMWALKEKLKSSTKNNKENHAGFQIGEKAPMQDLEEKGKVTK